MSKKLLLAIALIAIVSIAGISYSLVKNNLVLNEVDQNEDLCQLINIENEKMDIQLINDSLESSSSATKDVFDLSAEGGQQTNYTHNGETLLIQQTFYGETGKSNVAYYYHNEKVFYILKKNTKYVYPLSQNSSGTVESVELKEFYLDPSQELCFWYLNNELQSADTDSIELIKFLLSKL